MYVSMWRLTHSGVEHRGPASLDNTLQCIYGSSRLTTLKVSRQSPQFTHSRSAGPARLNRQLEGTTWELSLRRASERAIYLPTTFSTTCARSARSLL